MYASITTGSNEACAFSIDANPKSHVARAPLEELGWTCDTASAALWSSKTARGRVGLANEPITNPNTSKQKRRSCLILCPFLLFDQPRKSKWRQKLLFS